MMEMKHEINRVTMTPSGGDTLKCIVLVFLFTSGLCLRLEATVVSKPNVYIWFNVVAKMYLIVFPIYWKGNGASIIVF